MEFLKMDEVANKFIIMARIAVDLRAKGLVASVTLLNNTCNIYVHLGQEMDIVEGLYSDEATEAELLAWWEIIRAGK
jgi:hypothetical protein